MNKPPDGPKHIFTLTPMDLQKEGNKVMDAVIHYLVNIGMIEPEDAFNFASHHLCALVRRDTISDSLKGKMFGDTDGIFDFRWSIACVDENFFIREDEDFNEEGKHSIDDILGELGDDGPEDPPKP